VVVLGVPVKVVMLINTFVSVRGVLGAVFGAGHYFSVTSLA